MNTHTTDIIMARVHRVYRLRKLTQPFALKVYAAIAAFLGLASLVSIPNVIQNARTISDAASLYSFSKSALVNTEVAVQVTLTLGIIALALLVLDMAKRNTHALARV